MLSVKGAGLKSSYDKSCRSFMKNNLACFFKAKNNSFQLTFYVLIGEKPDKLTLKCEFSPQKYSYSNCTLLYFTAACSEATSCQVMICHAERKRSSSTFEPGKWMFQRGKMCNTHSHFHSQRWVLYLISNFHQPP